MEPFIENVVVRRYCGFRRTELEVRAFWCKGRNVGRNNKRFILGGWVVYGLGLKVEVDDDGMRVEDFAMPRCCYCTCVG